MSKLLLSLLLFLSVLQVKAQTAGDDKNNAKITQVAVLVDRNYDFDHIRSDQSLTFLATDSIKKSKAYWIRAIVNNQLGNTEKYYIGIYPNIITRFYFLNKTINKWTTRAKYFDHHIITDGLDNYPYEIEKKDIDTIYFWIDLRLKHIIKDKLKLSVKLKLKETEDHHLQNTKTAWLVGMIVLFLFFLNYLYIYFGLRDKPVLFYLIMQVGGLIYLTAYWRYFSLTKLRVYSFLLGDYFSIYDINQLMMHVGIVLIFYSYVQLTRSYLSTKKNLPVTDGILKYSLNIYIVSSIVLVAINMFGIDIEYYSIPYDNIYCGILNLIILYATIKAYMLKIPLSEAYLYSNLLPLLMMLGMPLYHLLSTANDGYNYWTPVLCVVAQALGFSIALVTRTKIIQKMLTVKELESKELAFNLIEVGYQNKLNEMQMVKMNTDMQLEKNRNELLQERLALQQRELASSTLYMVQKSELLTFLKDQLQKLNWLDRYHTKKNLNELNLLLTTNIQLDSDWGKFKLHFEQVHPEFFENLKREHPLLTQKEIRLYTYFQMNLSHKEIAALLTIDPASVRRSKTRLYKKMNITVGKNQQSDEELNT